MPPIRSLGQEMLEAQGHSSTAPRGVRVRSLPFANAVVSDRRQSTPDWVCLIGTFGQDEVRSFDPIYEDYALEKQGTNHQYRIDHVPTYASLDDVKLMEQLHPLPAPTGHPWVRFVRWTASTSYNKLFVCVFLINLAAQIVFLSELRHESPTIATVGNAATAASANFCVGVLMRNEHVINRLFLIACGIPHWVPLWIRRRSAKVYSYGGFHSACGVAGTIWYLVFFGLFTRDLTYTKVADICLSITTGCITCLLVCILVLAHPQQRRKWHNQFEFTHRFLGWSVVALFWCQVLIIVDASSTQTHRPWSWVLIRTPAFWFLLVITVCIAYPWSRLRKRKVQAEKLSNQAVRLRFDYTTLDTCYGIRLSDAPLRETHSFATIPNPRGERGFSVLISAAGDWTNKIIQNPPSTIWVRGAPVIGVARIALLFHKVVVVATGTGIGPCLSFLQARPDYPVRVLWSARKPDETYDAETIDAVLHADPKAVILDSNATGRCNLLALAYSLYRESGAEAVIVISNPGVVKMVVGGLEIRGVPAYGPIFDS